jgi:hypothetical protein
LWELSKIHPNIFIDAAGNDFFKVKTDLDEKLLFPTALELGSNGDMYISNRGFIPEEGEVLRFNASVPEPSSILGLAFLGGLGVRSQRKSKQGAGAWIIRLMAQVG